MPPERLYTTERNSALRKLAMPCQEQAEVFRLVGTKLYELQSTMRGLTDVHLAQNLDVHLIGLNS